MATLSLNVANDIVNAILKAYARGASLKQTIQERPLLAFLNAGKKTFGGGNEYLSDPVQGSFMSDADKTAVMNGGKFFQGYKEDDLLSFSQSANLLRAEYKWYECHAGLVITWTELKKDGITITDGEKKSEHSDIALTRLTSLLENRMDDFGESWARSLNAMFWQDGSQDSKQTPGILALLGDVNNLGTIGGLDSATYPWWRHRVSLNIPVSAANQSLSKRLRVEQRPLRRFGGKPNKFLAGSAFLDALDIEVSEKGLYTMTGFSKSQNDIGIAEIALRGVGVFEYDPTLDDLGRSNYCYEFDSRRIKLRPMEGEENKVLTPARPYQYMVYLKSMTWTGAMQMLQRNCHGVFSSALPHE